MLPPAAVGRAYAARLEPAGGTAPFTWAIESGSLPAGLALTPETGEVAGTPTEGTTAATVFTCTDRAGAAGSRGVLLYCASLADVTKRRSSGSLRVRGTVYPATARYLELTEGCLLDVTVTGGGAARVGPTLRLLAPDGSEADLGTALNASSHGARIRRFRVPSTGRWFVAVDAASGFKGTLRFAVAITPPAKWTATLAIDSAAPSPAETRFSAPPKAKLAISVAPVKHGTAKPVLLDVVGPGGASLLATGTARTKGQTVTFTSPTALAGGDYRVIVSAADGFPGDVVCIVTLRLAKTFDFELPDLAAGDGE
jgi:hypothetical protein